MIDIIGLYNSIKDVQDKNTRWVLYIEFCKKYFPECYNAMLGDRNIIREKLRYKGL